MLSSFNSNGNLRDNYRYHFHLTNYKTDLPRLNGSLSVAYSVWPCLEAQVEEEEPLQPSLKHRAWI